jgi:hypothetical protein
LYYFSNGETEVCKISKRIFTENPVDEGNIIYITDIKKKYKVEKVGNEWVKNTEAFDTWIEKYIVK